MTQPFTPELLVKFLYKETTASETLAVNEALYNDPGLQAEYENLRQAERHLPKVKFQPSSNTLQNILRYSERTTVGKTA
jgi:hypothetical protein